MVLAKMIPEATIDQVQNAVNIVDYVGQFVQLKKQGQNMFGLCPFHDENTPSFSVNEEKQIFHCFSCGRGGSVFKFVMDLDGVSFPEAVAKVAEFGHVDVQINTTVNQPRESATATRQKELLAQVQKLFNHLLVNTAQGEPALDYLHGRQMTDETIEHFGIGFAPSDDQMLRKYLTKEGVSYEEQRASGLFVDRDGGELATRFTNRVMFPLRNERGQTIGFSGRVLGKQDGVAKYLNSPETELFNKRDTLFNLDQAKAAINPDKRFYLFEGFMDVITAYEAGVQTGIASMGTSLTREQIGIIDRVANEVVISYDGDMPGQKAADRALGMLQNARDLRYSVCLLPDGMDPDEFIKNRGADAFKQQLQHVLTPIAFRIMFLANGVDMTNDHDKIAYVDAALAEIARETEAVPRSLYLDQLAERSGVPRDALSQQLASTQVAPAPALGADNPFGAWDDNDMPPEPTGGWSDVPPADPTGQPQTFVQPQMVRISRFEKAERALLYYMLTDSETANLMGAEAVRFPHDLYQTIAQQWQDYRADGHDDISGFTTRLSDEEGQTVAALLSTPWPPVNDETTDGLLKVLGGSDLRQQLGTVKEQLQQAQRLGDQEGQTRLANQYFELMRQLKA